MPTKLPVTEIKDLATAIAHTLNAADAVFADGKVDGKDLLRVGGLLGALKDYGEVDFGQVLPQYGDMDEVEAADVSAHFAKELDLSNDTVEATIETGNGILQAAVPAVLGLKAAYDQWKAARNK